MRIKGNCLMATNINGVRLNKPRKCLSRAWKTYYKKNGKPYTSFALAT